MPQNLPPCCQFMDAIKEHGIYLALLFSTAWVSQFFLICLHHGFYQSELAYGLLPIQALENPWQLAG